MTRQDIITTLPHLATGRRNEDLPAWHVEEASGRLVIEADGAGYDVEVRPSIDDRDLGHDLMDEILSGMEEGEREAFFRDLDDAADEAEREGPVPAEDLRRSLDEAQARGLRVWNARHSIPE